MKEKFEMEKIELKFQGCTAVVVLILKDKYFVANAGDSRCLLIKKNWDTIWLTEDHKPECPKELE